MKKASVLLLTPAGLMLGLISVVSAQTVATPGDGTFQTHVQAAATPAPHPAATQKASTAVGDKPFGPSTVRLLGLNDQGLAKVFRVRVDYGEGGEAFVDVSTTNPAVYRILNLKNPPRLVVDIENARIENLKRTYPARSSVLKDARIGQFRDNVVRVVADLAGNPLADVYPEPGGLRIALRPAGSDGADSGSETRSSSMLAAQAKNPPPQATAARRPNSESRTPSQPLAAKVSSSPAGVGVKAAESALAPPALTSRPPSTSRMLSAPAVAPPLQVVRAVPVSLTNPWLRAAARPEPPPLPLGSLGAERAAQILAADAQASRAGSMPKAPTDPRPQVKPRYTGEVVSVNLKDVDLTDFFRLIHEVSGLNIIVDPSVAGKLTLVLDSVPWDQALDIVLSSNGLGKALEGNVLRVAKQSTLEREADASAKLEEARVQSGPLATVLRPLKYARAVDTQPAQSTIPGLPPPVGIPGLAALLKNLPGVLSARGSVAADPRDNALIITDLQSQIPVIEAVIDKLDVKPRQISIEAKIVAANTDFVRDLQSALSGAFKNQSGSTAAGGTAGAGAAAQGNIPPPSGITLAQTAAAGFGALAISNQSARYFINAAIAAAQTRDQLKLISAPTIITQNNVLGKVSQGIEVPFQTTIINTVSTQFKDATLELDVTPQVTGDGNILLSVYVQDDTVGAVVPGLGTSINHQAATTQVLISDGGTVVFGGIKFTRRARTVTQVPGLGSVPVLGNLFKSIHNDENDQELLFFVTPKILPDDIAQSPRSPETQATVDSVICCDPRRPGVLLLLARPGEKSGDLKERTGELI